MYDSPSVSYFLQNISREPRPGRADEQDQVARATVGDRAATELLIASNLAYVVHIAKEFRGRGLPFEDLIAEGCVGLLEAIRRYRPAEATRFMTYASFWVRKRILAAVTNQPQAVHVPRYARQHGYERIRVERLDVPNTAGGDLRLIDSLRHPDPLPADTIVEAEQQREVRREVLRLTPRERDVIACRFGLAGHAPQTLEAIAARLGLSKERVRQIELAALARLRNGIAGPLGSRDRSWIGHRSAAVPGSSHACRTRPGNLTCRDGGTDDASGARGTMRHGPHRDRVPRTGRDTAASRRPATDPELHSGRL